MWRRKRLEEQLDKELRFHMDQHAADLIARGVAPEEAQRQARIELGGAAQVKESRRDVRTVPLLEDLWRDFRYALRTLRRQPGLAAVILLTLGLGIGAVTVIFTVINGVLFKPLPYRQPESLVQLQERTEQPTQFGNLWAFTYPNFVDCKLQSQTLAPLVAWRYRGGIVSRPGEAEFVDGFEISAELFSVLGVPLARGRTFLPQEDAAGARSVVILSHGFWQRRFGGKDAALGSPLEFDGTIYTVVGVAPAGFRLLDDAAVYLPIGQNTEPRMRNREVHSVGGVWARLRPDVTLPEARAELAQIGRGLTEQYPRSNSGRTFVADRLTPSVGDVRPTLWLLLGAVTLVLLIACVNVASLLLARAVSRERELAMRLALGAGRGRLVRQCLTESAVLGLAGGLFGVVLASVGIRPFLLLWPGGLPRAEEVQLDWRVLGFACVVSLACGVLFGLAPALRVGARQLGLTVRAATRQVHGAFVAAEIALAIVLLVAAGTLGRTLLRLSSADPGVDVRRTLVSRVALPPGVLANAGQTRSAWQDFLDRSRQTPGVEAIAMVDTVPMRGGNNQLGYWPSADLPPRARMPLALAASVSPDYLNVMGISLRSGRFFDARDAASSTPVIVIDEVLAQQAFGGMPAVGQRLWVPDMDPQPMLVVGVTAHVRYWGLAADDQAKVRAQLYYSFTQVPDRLLRRWSELMSVVVRTRADAASVVDPLRRLGPVLYETRTMEQLAGASLDRQRFLLMLFGVFAALSLVLACIGIYGVLAYLTRQRVPEIGVRMALGATALDVIRMVMQESLRMVAIGTVLGLAGAAVAVRILVRLVDGVRPGEYGTVGVMISVLVAAALAASFLPALRASRIDPLPALRQE